MGHYHSALRETRISLTIKNEIKPGQSAHRLDNPQNDKVPDRQLLAIHCADSHRLKKRGLPSAREKKEKEDRENLLTSNLPPSSDSAGCSGQTKTGNRGRLYTSSKEKGENRRE